MISMPNRLFSTPYHVWIGSVLKRPYQKKGIEGRNKCSMEINVTDILTGMKVMCHPQLQITEIGAKKLTFLDCYEYQTSLYCKRNRDRLPEESAESFAVTSFSFFCLIAWIFSMND